MTDVKALFISVAIMAATFSTLAVAQDCPTDSLKPLIGSYSGYASIITIDDGSFTLRRPKAFAPKTISNDSTFTLDEANPCHEFHVQIDYLNPKWVATLTGEKIVRTVQFDGRSTDQQGLFTLSTGGVAMGHLRPIDDRTFMATFDAPNPLAADQMTSCKEFISLTADGKHIVRTIQCFDKHTGDFVQDRVTFESFK